MKTTIFSLQNGEVIKTFKMDLKHPYTPINIGEQIVLTQGIFKVINVIHTPEIHRREIAIERWITKPQK